MLHWLVTLPLALFAASLSVMAADMVVTQTSKCRVLTTHVADADVAYVPGRDVVDGKPVIPADPDASEEQLVPQNFEIEIDVDLAGQVAAPQGPAGYQPRAKVGRVAVQDLQGDTKIDFNGQKLHRGGPQAVSPECLEENAKK